MQDTSVRPPAEGRTGSNLPEASQRFLALFEPNLRSLGRWDPSNGKMHTEHKQVELADVERHLSGAFGLGLVPVLDDGTCKWAAIDIDNHGEDKDIPIGPIDKKLAAFKIPLIPCRSKSGGVHVYAFFEETWPVDRAKDLLAKAAKSIGYPDAEIFPKQANLMNGSKARFGNWINLPYVNGDDTVRYAYRNGKKLTLEQFLTWAESNRIKQGVDHPDAPPCIQRMIEEGVDRGQRNEAIYNITVYSRKRSPSNYEELPKELNNTIFSQPLGSSELNRTIGSAARPEMKYRCNEEPIKSLCDRRTCLKRKYGIVPEEQQNSLPEFTNLVKHLTDPIRWEFDINGVRVTNVTTEDLLDWNAMRRMIAERLTTVAPFLKKEEWSQILMGMMATARVEEAPEDASVAGIIRARLRDFATRAHDLHDNKNMQDRQTLLRGLPIIATFNGIKSIAFRSQDFINYLKRTKSEELRGANLWFAIRELGPQTTRMRVNKNSAIHVWYIPYKEIDGSDIQPDDLDTKSEV